MFSLGIRSAFLMGKGKLDSKADESVTRLTLELADIKLNPEEFCQLLREPHAWDILYNSGANPVEPFLKGFKSLELVGTIEGAYLRIDVGLTSYTRFDFKDCSISKIKLELQTGGETSMSCKVTFTPVMTSALTTLFEFLSHSVQLELRGEAPGAQQDLPLNTFTDGGEQSALSNTGQQIARAAEKVERKTRQRKNAEKLN